MHNGLLIHLGDVCESKLVRNGEAFSNPPSPSRGRSSVSHALAVGEDIATVGASTLSKSTVKALALGELPLDGEAGLGTASAFSSLMRCTRGKLAFYEFIHAY